MTKFSLTTQDGFDICGGNIPASSSFEEKRLIKMEGRRLYHNAATLCTRETGVDINMMGTNSETALYHK